MLKLNYAIEVGRQQLITLIGMDSLTQISLTDSLVTNAPIAMRMGKINELAAACNAEVIPADATSEQDLTNLFFKVCRSIGW